MLGERKDFLKCVAKNLVKDLWAAIKKERNLSPPKDGLRVGKQRY